MCDQFDTRASRPLRARAAGLARRYAPNSPGVPRWKDYHDVILANDAGGDLLDPGQLTG